MTDTLRVLYVDDDPILLKTGKFYLERNEEFAVDTLTSANEAFTRINTVRYDAIVSDYQMPGMDGIEFLKKIRASGNTIPFILFTGKGREEVVINALNEGADFYHQKGGEPEALFAELAHKLKSAINRHTVEDALHKSEEKYRRIVETSHEGIWSMDEHFVTNYVNNRMAEMLGYSVEEILGKTITSFMSEEELADNQKKLGQRMNGQPGYYERRFKAKDGTILTFNVSATPIMDDKGLFTGSFAMLTDITARKRAEEDLKKNAEELHAANEQLAAAEEELKGQFDALAESERLIRENEGRFDQLAEQSRTLVWEVDARGLFSYVSHVFEIVLGYRPDELVGRMHFYDLHPVSGREEFRISALAVFEQKEPFQNLVNAVQAKDGRVLWVTTNGIPVLNADGTLRGYRGSDTDITERRQAEIALLKSTEELHTTYDELAAAGEELKSQFDALTESERSTRIIVERLLMAEEMGHTANWEYDLVTNKLWGSPEGHRIYGLTPVDGDFSLEDLEACIPDRVRLRQALVDLISEGKEFNLECSVIPRDGSAQKMIHTVARLEKDAQGNPIKVLGIIQDITKRKQAEDALREGEERYRYLFDSAPDGIKVVDETGVIVDCSQRTLDVTGYTKEELLGKHITHDILPSSKNIFSAKFPLLQQNKPVEGELQIVRKNGNIVWIWRKGFPLPDRAGKFAGALLYDRDITDRKLTEDTLIKVNQKLNVLSQLTRQDLTTQIFVLNSYLEMAKTHATGQDGIIKNIESGERAIKFIKEITEFTKDYQNMGEKPPKYQNVKLSFLFGLSHISIGEIQHSLETENLEIFTDPLLEKAFQGMLENSVKHGGHVSHIRVSHTITPDSVTIVFEDDGVGIPNEKKERIFLRGEGARASVRGLVFVQEILDITGITIRETGVQGKGARFEMMVPKGSYRLQPDKGTG